MTHPSANSNANDDAPGREWAGRARSQFKHHFNHRRSRTMESTNAELPPTACPPLFGIAGEAQHEKLLLTHDADSGLSCIIAIHSTARGPAFGGCRMWRYANDAAALTDALRLSQGMSMKNALADLPYGGGKAVILKPEGGFDRVALFAAFGRAVQAAQGHYITAEDVGTTTADMLNVQAQTRYVSGIPRAGTFGGDPSPRTAYGVFVAIEQGVRWQLKRGLGGITVAVQGLGAVGMSLAERLHDAGARLVVADVNPARTQEAMARFQARVVGVEDILSVPCDVLAPCALGAVFDSVSVGKVKAGLVCGGANNQLATALDGDALHARGVLYLPDYLVNAGGIVSVAREYLGQGDEVGVMVEVGRIGTRVTELLDRASGTAPSRAADAWAREKLRAKSTQ
jgi:leucine dehydrogenase